MDARVTTRPLAQVLSAIQALDLESVKARMMDEELGEGWSREYADGIETAYKTYLSMLVKYPEHAEDILIHKAVDEFWHTHILQTRKYAVDCEQVFGNFLHHNPHIGERTPDYMTRRVSLAEKTRRLYKLEFGEGSAADMAWAGIPARDSRAAYCDAAVGSPKGAAYCDVAVGAGQRAAYCDAAVGSPKGAAYCDVAVGAGQSAAYCDAAVGNPKDHSYCA